MRILSTNSFELHNVNDQMINELFKDFLIGSNTNALTLVDIKEIFGDENIKEIVFLKGRGATFEDAISMIKNSAIGFNPMTAKRILVMASVRSKRISNIIRIMERFKKSLDYTFEFRWGFVVNPNQETDYIINIAEAELLDEEAITRIDVKILDETFHVNVKWKEAKRIKNASNIITEKINTYMQIFKNKETETRILMMAMIDMATTSFSFDNK